MGSLDFIDRIGQLTELLPEIEPPADGRAEFVVVVQTGLVPRGRAMEVVERRGKAGFSVMDDADLARFTAIDSVELPEGLAYLMTDVDTGGERLEHDARRRARRGSAPTAARRSRSTRASRS